MIETAERQAEGRPATDPPPARGRRRGFEVDVDGEICSFAEIHGFREALLASIDARAPMPERLALLVPDERARVWLAGWAEDAGQVRRTVTLRRLFDERALVAVVTLSTYGHGVDAALSVESVVPTDAQPESWLRRSGVYSCVEVEAALARPAARAEPSAKPTGEPSRGLGVLISLARWRGQRVGR